MNKKIIKTMTAVVVILMMLSSSAVYAAGELRIFVDNVMIETEVPPVIINGRTMVPVRAVAEAANCQVQWDEEQKKISISAPYRAQPLMYMYLDNPIVNVYVYNSETMETAVDEVEIDAAPVLVNGRTMVPLRFIAETMGFELEWNEAEGAIYLRSGPELTAAGGYDDNTQFPLYAEYTEDYVPEGDPGEYISARTAALILALDILPGKYTDVNSEGKFKITLTGISDAGGEECYMFTVEGENGDIRYYAVSYTQQVTEIQGPMDKDRAEDIVMETTKEQAQNIEAAGAKPAYVFKGEGEMGGYKAWFFDLGTNTAEKFTSEYRFAADEQGNVWGKDIFGKWLLLTEE